MNGIKKLKQINEETHPAEKTINMIKNMIIMNHTSPQVGYLYRTRNITHKPSTK